MFSQIPNLRIHNFFREIVLVFLTCRNFCLLRQKMLLKLFIFTKRHFAAPLKENKTFLHEINSWIRKLGIRENISRAIYHISFSSSNTQFYKSRISISQFKVVQSVGFFLFNIASYIGIFGYILIIIQNIYLEKILKK